MNLSIKAIVITLALITVSPMVANAQTDVEDAKDKKMAIYLASIAKKIGGQTGNGVKSVSMNWPENEEVKEVSGYHDMKRVAALWELFNFQKTIEEKTFPSAKSNQDQLAISLITRLMSFSKYQSFLGESNNDLIVKAALNPLYAQLTAASLRLAEVNSALAIAANPNSPKPQGFIAGFLSVTDSRQLKREREVLVKQISDLQSSTQAIQAAMQDSVATATPMNTMKTIVKDYLDSEIADLKMIFSGKMPVELYFKSRKIREEKLGMLLLTDKDFWMEILTFRSSKGTTLEALANKTFLISLFESCYENKDVCLKLSGK